MRLQRMNQVVNETPEEIIKQLEAKGFKKKKTRGACMYYRKDGERYAVVATNHKNTPNDKVLIIVEDAVVKKLGYPSIYLKSRNDGKEVPCIYMKSIKKYKTLHRVMIDTELDIDHINSNVYVCIFENLRPCTKKQNNLNSSRCVIIEDIVRNGVICYGHKVEVDEKQMRELIPLGFKIQSNSERTGKYILESPLCNEVVSACQIYTEAEKILLEGTDMVQFVYDIMNDFSRTLNLLIHHYVLHDITKEEAYKMNLLYWSMLLDGVQAA